MTGPVHLDTTIRPPSPTDDETRILVFAVERSRAQFAWKVGELDDAALHRPQPPSAVTLASLVKHLAFVEDYRRWCLTGEPMGEPWDAVAARGEAVDDWSFESAAGDRADDLYALYAAAVERSRAAMTAFLADGGADRLTPWVLRDGSSPKARLVLMDLHDEYARHVGHADLFREAVDGRVGEDPPQ